MNLYFVKYICSLFSFHGQPTKVYLLSADGLLDANHRALGTSLVVQNPGLPTQGTQVQSLFWELDTSCSTKIYMHLCSVTLVMSNSATSWTKAHQAPLSMEFSRQEYGNGLPCPPPPGDLSNPGIKPVSLKSPALTGGFFTISATSLSRV